MRRIITMFAAVALALGMTSAAAAACKDPATGKFVACPAASTTPTAAAGGYSLDAKGKCRDAKGKMAKKSMCAGSAAAATTPMSAHASAKATRTSPMAASTTPMSAHTSGGGAMSSMSKMSATSSDGGPVCKKGKRCGAACISVNDVCHKQ